MKQTTKVRR